MTPEEMLQSYAGHLQGIPLPPKTWHAIADVHAATKDIDQHGATSESLLRLLATMRQCGWLVEKALR